MNEIAFSDVFQVFSFIMKMTGPLSQVSVLNCWWIFLMLCYCWFICCIRLYQLQLNFIMQKSKDITSIVEKLNTYAITSQFLDLAHYKSTQQHARKANNFYESMCKILEGNYRLILELPDKCGELLLSKTCIDRWQIGRFKSFLQKMFEIFNMVSEFQIEGLSRLRTSKQLEDNSQATFQDFVSGVDKYGKEQQKLENYKQTYKVFVQSLESKSAQTIQRMKKIENYYNIKTISAELNVISTQLKEKGQLQDDIAEQSQIVAKNTKDFEEELMFYRQQLIVRKYENIDKIARLCKNAKQSLVEMFSYLYQYIKQQQQFFSKKKLMEEESILSGKTEVNKLSEVVISQASAYQKVIEKYLQLMKGLIDCFAGVASESKELKLKQNEIIQSLTRYYEYNECDINEIKLTLNLYSSFLKLIGQLGDKLVFSYNNFLQLQKNVIKCTQMTLTLIKCSQHKKSPTNSRKESLHQRDRKTDETLNGLEMLKDQLSQVYVTNIINKVYQDFRDTSFKIRDEFQCLNPNRRKKLENSMSISYITEINIPIQKRPSKRDIWLWKDCKIQFTNSYIEINQIVKLYKELQLLSQKYKEEDKEIQKLNCSLKKKRVNGLLKLREKSVLFESFDNNLILFIPITHIEYVDLQLKLMAKIFKIQTQAGSLQFVDEAQGDIKKFYVNAQKAIDSFNQRGDQNVKVQVKMVLTEAELEFIQKRKKQVQKELQNANQYEYFNTLVLPDTHIVDLYRIVYSGNSITLGGKQYENFQASLMNKYNNFNEKYYGFDKPPPSYYSGVEGVSFFNCPLYSQKAIEYDHKLPKMPILPQTCHNFQTMRFYWISHEQFHIRETNKTSNAPFTQNFYLVQLFKIRQDGNNVEMKFYIKLVEVKDFTFKSMVQGKAKQQAKFGMTILIDQIKKVMAKYRKREANIGKIESINEVLEHSIGQNTEIKEFKYRIQKLQTKNRVLIYVLIAVFIVNILLKLF